MNKRNFTRCELLVILCCIACLTALLLPVIAQENDRSNEIRCKANLKVLHTALRSYTEAHDDYFPSAYNVREGYYWFDRLRGFANEKPLWGKTAEAQPGAFACPGTNACYATAPGQESGGTRYAVNYAYNNKLYESKSSVGQAGALVSPAEVLVFADANILDEQQARPPATVYYVSDHAVCNARYGKMAPGFTAHAGFAQIMYMDGHAAALKKEDLKKENINPEWN